MVRIPHIKIPSVRVGGIDPTSDIGTAIGGVQPTPITYLTNWKIVGNSEVVGNDIWSCGEYSATDGKYHILVQPLGGSIADIALDEPLRKVNDVADTIEFADGVATLTRAFGKVDWLNDTFEKASSSERTYFIVANNNIKTKMLNILSPLYITASSIWAGVSDPVLFPNLHINSHPTRNLLRIVDEDKNDLTAVEFAQANANADVEIIYELATPTTETIQVPQIQEAESYSCVISQGGKAVSWSSFTTESGSE